MNARPPHVWKFFRSGGLDQVALETADDLLALDQLDPKLWVALSCPVKGLELDERTLALIDTDRDGRIGVPEIIAAVKWAAARLVDPADLLKGDAVLPLAAIDGSKPDGAVLLASARQILAGAGRADAAEITVAEAGDTARIFAASPLNGDGLLPPAAGSDPAVQALLRDIAATTGGTPRANGVVGVSAAQIDAFFADLAAYAAWAAHRSEPALAVLGDATASAAEAIRAVRAKVDDYFARTRLAAFDPRAVEALNRSENAYLELAAKDLTLTGDELRALPLAHIEAARPLPLLDGVNPSWADPLRTLHATAVTAVFGADHASLSPADWAVLTAKFAAYEAWLARKPAAHVESLGLPRVQEILAGSGRVALADLLARDAALAPAFRAISDVERLARYRRDLRTLLHNFVNFADFYSRDRYAAFQAGTLYLDSRSTELCIRVDGPSPLAAMSKAYIAYCACTPAGGGAPITLAACFTQGDSDYLFVGRNGLFYDRQGRLWYAVITSLIDNPIGIRQAFWAPYKKLLRFIEEQVAKRAAAADAEASTRLASTAEKTAHLDKAKPEPVRKVDVGTVAALGVAITGAISALTLILGYVFGLKAWQYPLAALGIILVISGPSMMIAWLKLRQRTLGPILEANGWAINGRVKINLPFGAALTEVATLPPGSRRSLEDPYEDKAAARARRRAIALAVLVVLAAAAIWIRWDRLQRGHYFWQPAPATPAAPAPAAAPVAPVTTPAPAK